MEGFLDSQSFHTVTIPLVTYENENNQALLSSTSVDHENISKSLNRFKNKWDKFTFNDKTIIIRKKTLSVM